MERLTVYESDGDAWPKELYNSGDTIACGEWCDEYGACGCCPVQACFNKLAAYEDIGLSPKGVKKLIEEYTLLLYDQKRKAKRNGG